VVTLHRPSNVDRLVEQLEPLAVRSCAKCPNGFRWSFALHPRTRANIEQVRPLLDLLTSDRIVLLPPQGYLEMLGLLTGARLVLSDSGGLQEETTALGVPCLTMRENTERPITVDQGTNTLVGRDPQAIRKGVDEILSGAGKTGSRSRSSGMVGQQRESLLTCRRGCSLAMPSVAKNLNG
jgi:UDP-N-acetylglucosamine 2-epimerase (non-hydrolysing)